MKKFLFATAAVAALSAFVTTADARQSNRFTGAVAVNRSNVEINTGNSSYYTGSVSGDNSVTATVSVTQSIDQTVTNTVNQTNTDN